VAEDDVTRKRIDDEEKEEGRMRCWCITVGRRSLYLGYLTRKSACLSRLAAASGEVVVVIVAPLNITVVRF
jgi:hypothetical protein